MCKNGNRGNWGEPGTGTCDKIDLGNFWGDRSCPLGPFQAYCCTSTARNVLSVPFGRRLTGSYSGLAGLLLDHASRILVLAQANKLRMSQPISLGPFQELNLRDRFWP